jgi:hypothetical protein
VGYDVTGFSTPFVGVQWTKTARDKDIARAVVVFLEDRRVLFAHRHVEDEQHCVESVLQIRTFLTEQIMQAKPGKDLKLALRHMRSACRRFLEAAGPAAESSGTTLATGMTRSSWPWVSCERVWATSWRSWAVSTPCRWNTTSRASSLQTTMART